MPFPPSERQVYARNPLEAVFCQLTFPPILRIEAEPPAEFQERVRQRYPLYERESPASLLPPQISSLLASFAVPRVDQQHIHKFLTVDRSRFVSLTQSFVVVTETKYERWESLRDEVQFVADTFQTAYMPAFYSRIGLRYRDVIDRDTIGLGNVAWAELLNPALVGPLGAPELAGEVEGIASHLLVRPAGMPGAVQIAHGLAQGPDSQGRIRQFYVIDSDLFGEGNWEGANVCTTLDEFNRHAGYLFRWAITPRLMDALGAPGQ